MPGVATIATKKLNPTYDQVFRHKLIVWESKTTIML